MFNNCSQEKFATCFTAMKERNPAEFKSVTEQLMQHLQNNIEVRLLWPKYTEPPSGIWDATGVKSVVTPRIPLQSTLY